jgi:hypothetical protein
MLPAALLLVVVTVGFVVPCLIDVVITPEWEYRRFTRPTWLLLIIFLSVPGALAWLLAGRPFGVRRYGRHSDRRRAPFRYRHRINVSGFEAAEAFRRHPASGGSAPLVPGRPLAAGRRAERPWAVGPDDDPEFLLELDRRIQQWRESAGDS